MDQIASEPSKKKRGDTAKTLARRPDGKFISNDGANKGYKKYRPKKLLDKMTLQDALAQLKAGTISASTIAGKQFVAIQELLEIDARATVIELIRHDIATYAVLCRAIIDYCQDNKGKIISEKGQFPDALLKLPKYQACMARGIDILLKLEGNKATNTLQDKDIADMVLELSQNEDDQDIE